MYLYIGSNAVLFLNTKYFPMKSFLSLATTVLLLSYCVPTKEWMLKSRKMLSDGEDHRLTFDVHTLPSGVYYLRVTDDYGHSDILKFIKL